MEKLDMKSVINRGSSFFLVSTVCLPVIHDGGWFETMVFPCDTHGHVTHWGERFMLRYHTEEEAIKGHEDTVQSFNP